MNKILRKTLPPLLTVCMALGITACGEDSGKSGSIADDIVNGDFEDVSAGSWVGWTRQDAAFNFRGVVDADEVNGAPIEKSGSYFFSGTAGGNPAMRGTLTSDVFKLGGNGFITFKMGAGKNTEKAYVEFFEEGNDVAIARITNPECDGVFITDHLITKVVDLSAYVGKNIYIKVTDEDDGNDFSYINLDAFKVCTTDEEVAAARAEYTLQIETYGEKPFVEDETATDIVNGGFETGDLTGWKTLEGTALVRSGVVPTSQYYWEDRSVYGEGEYYLDGSNNGAIAENLTGAIRSTKFTLAGDGYISFMIGAGNGDCYVALCDGDTDEELITVRNEYFNDPSLALTLLRTYMDASQYIGKVVYLKVVDANDGGGFAFLNVDDFRVSLTVDEVAELEVRQMEKAQAEEYSSATYDDLAAIRNYYNSYPYPVPLNSLTITSYVSNKVVSCGSVDVTTYLEEAAASYGGNEISDLAVSKVVTGDTEITDGFDAVDMSAPGYYHVTYTASYEGATAEATFTVVAQADDSTIANGGFEAGNLAGWTVLTDGWSVVDGQAAGVISAENYWGEALPYNQAGDYHLDGWNTGLDEGATWAIQSTNFTLAGSGYISVRMGGHAAAVHVYLADGTEVGYYRQNRFNDANFPSVGAGGSWADMGTYVMDLSAYLGKELYIVLADEQAEGWAHAFFDEVVTYYEAAPDYANEADEVPDGATGDPVLIPWQLAENNL
ncbi:MAG: hypothetical protein NC543_12785 [bacterium]|nr:hypothetical protein [bacterium]MCM1374731.1 hypothetical protein [Muribaculum sp.]